MSGWVYLIGLGEGRPFKVGRTYQIENRLNNLQSGNHEELHILVGIETDDPVGVEFHIQSLFAAHRIRGEWYDWNDDLPPLLEKLKAGCARTFRKLQCTGHLRLADGYDRSHVARIGENRRKKALRG